jgi:hypothetical protein
LECGDWSPLWLSNVLEGRTGPVELLKRGLTLIQAATILAASRNTILNERKRF